MRPKRLSICVVHGCPEIAATRGRCQHHQLKSNRNGSQAGWRKAREAILDRDGYQCTHTEDGNRCHVTENLHIDHIIPKVHGGTEDRSNLRVLCATHNLRKGSKVDV